MGYADVVLADSPYVLYRLGEASGTTAVNAQGTTARNGTYVNTPTLGATGALQGDADTAVTLASGSSQYIDAPVSGLGALMGNGFTFECWIKTTATTAQRLFGLRTGNPFIQCTINENAAGKLRLNIRANTTSLILDGQTTTTAGIHDNAWHHVVLTGMVSTNTITIYVDGVLRPISYTSQTTPNAFTFTNNGAIGAENNSGSISAYISATLDEVAIYNSILTADQVRTHYAAGLNVFASAGLVSPLSSPLIRGVSL